MAEVRRRPTATPLAFPPDDPAVGLHLTHDDAAHLSAAVEALLAPSVGPDPLPWWSHVEDRLRTLFGGANVMITWPQGTRLRYAGRHLDSAAQRRFETLSAADPETGLHINFDPGVVAWFEYRRARGVQVWHETENFQVMRAAGIDGARGLSDAKPPATLGVSAHTARHHTERVMQKLGVRRRAEVAATLLKAAG